MLNKLEFSDINRYFVSVGTILIAISFLLPYFYLKENFGIIISEKDYNTYTKTSKLIITNKQNNILFFQTILIYLSGFLFITGCAFSYFGINRWLERQKKIDHKFDKELEKLEIEVIQMTPQEKDEKINNEISETLKEKENDGSFNYQQNQSLRQKYVDVENLIIKKFTSLGQSIYKVLPNVKIQDRIFDILLQSNKSDFSDKIIEIKFFNHNIHSGLLKDSIIKLDYNLVYYKKNTNRKVSGIMYFVYNNENITEERIEEIKAKLNQGHTLHLINKISVEFIKLNEIENFEIVKNII